MVMCWIDRFQGRMELLITEQLGDDLRASQVPVHVVDSALGLLIDEASVKLELAQLRDDAKHVREIAVERRLWRQIASRWRECRDDGGYLVLKAWMNRVRELSAAQAA